MVFSIDKTRTKFTRVIVYVFFGMKDVTALKWPQPILKRCMESVGIDSQRVLGESESRTTLPLGKQPFLEPTV
jgi:hypothetical protein